MGQSVKLNFYGRSLEQPWTFGDIGDVASRCSKLFALSYSLYTRMYAFWSQRQLARMFCFAFFSWEEKGRTRNVLDFRSRRIIFVVMAHAACAGFNQLCLFYFPVHTTEVFRFNTSNNYKWCAPARTKLHGKLRKKCLCKSHGRKSAWTQKVELGLGHRGINAK